MMPQLLHMPLDETIFARLTERQAEANAAQEYADAVAEAQRIIDNPRGYTDDQLREVCAAYMACGAGGVHYLRADEHIYAINRREQIARNRAAQSSWAVVQEQREHWPQIIVWGAVVATAMLAAMGWLG
jgi:hypothetical protein